MVWEPMPAVWASYEEYMEEWRRESFSAQEMAEYEQMLSECAAEEAWLRYAENDPRMSDPREW